MKNSTFYAADFLSYSLTEFMRLIRWIFFHPFSFYLAVEKRMPLLYTEENKTITFIQQEEHHAYYHY